MYEIVRRRFAGQEVDMVPIPESVWDAAVELARLRQAWHGTGKPTHWKGYDEHIFGNVAELQAARMLRGWGATGWEQAPLFNAKFDRPMDKGGSPPWDIRLGIKKGYTADSWRQAVPGNATGWNGVSRAAEVKATGYCPMDKWVMRVKEVESKPHPRLVIFATMMLSFDRKYKYFDQKERRMRPTRPEWMLPFHYITSSRILKTPPTPLGEPFAPYRACRVFPFPGFMHTDRNVTGRTNLGPTLKPLTKSILLQMSGGL